MRRERWRFAADNREFEALCEFSACFREAVEAKSLRIIYNTNLGFLKRGFDPFWFEIEPGITVYTVAIEEFEELRGFEVVVD